MAKQTSAPKFLTYNKSIIDRLKPYGPPKIKWDAGTGKYQNIGPFYLQGYGIQFETPVNPIYIEFGKGDLPKISKSNDPLLQNWLKGGDSDDTLKNASQKGGSFYLKKQTLSPSEWSENAILPSNKFIGNYIFEQNANHFSTLNRRYILTDNESTKNELKKKVNSLLPSDDELAEVVANRCAAFINELFVGGHFAYEAEKVVAVGKVQKTFFEELGDKISSWISSDNKKEPQPEIATFEEIRSGEINKAEIYQYCVFRKCFDIYFNGEQREYYDETLKFSTKNKDITIPAEPNVELFNQDGLDGIYGMKYSFPVSSSWLFWQYSGSDEDIRMLNEDNLLEAYNRAVTTKIKISLDDVKRYLSDLFDVGILMLKNDSSVYFEVVDKLFPFVSGRNKDTFCKKFFSYFTNSFVSNNVINSSNYTQPILINSEIGSYSTADKISKILTLAKTKLKTKNLTVTPSLTSSNTNSITASIDRVFSPSSYRNYFIFCEGYGYLDNNELESNWPWPAVEDESELVNLNHTLSVQFFTSLAKYAQVCGVALSLIFNSETRNGSDEKTNHWKYYNAITFNKFVVDHLIMSKEDKEMALDIKTEEGPEGEKRERVVLNEFDIRQSVRDITNSIWYLDDYNWSMDRKNLNELGMEITDFQKLRIYEFQQDKQMSFKRLAQSIIDTFNSAFEIIGGKNKIGEVVRDLLKAGTTAAVNKFSASDIESKNYATNVDWISELMHGTWVGQYDVPFFGKNFLKADTTEKWAMGNLADSAEFLKNDLTTNVQDIPTWSYSPGKAEAITTTIYLLNEDVDSIIKNLKFLHSITAGAWWVQTSFIGYRQPNLYRVLCPGRFIMLYAAMAITAEMIGKIRRYSQQDAEEMFGKGSETNDFMPFKLYTSAGEGNCNIPEAYKLTLKFQDLTPQVFNVMANFFTNGYGNESTKLYPNIFVKQLDAKIMDQIENNFNGAVKQVKGRPEAQPPPQPPQQPQQQQPQENE